uniref:Prephenate/arogenate dehydrogenase domain-containing protein n=1 Tax=Fibrocapsa japonica TaxID=94617 RepID=A0A6U1Q1C7_9STRA
MVAVSILSFEEVLRSLPPERLKGRLVMDVLSIKSHPRNIMLEALPEDCDILCTHPMFGPETASDGWQGLPFVYDKVRVVDHSRCDAVLRFFGQRCKVVEMACDQHDALCASSQFMTHLIGRLVADQGLHNSPVDSKSCRQLFEVGEATAKDSFDLFYGLYRYNRHGPGQLRQLKESLAHIERQLAAKEGYLTAKAEEKDDNRGKLMADVRYYIREGIEALVREQAAMQAAPAPVPPPDTSVTVMQAEEAPLPPPDISATVMQTEEAPLPPPDISATDLQTGEVPLPPPFQTPEDINMNMNYQSPPFLQPEENDMNYQVPIHTAQPPADQNNT